MMLSEEEIQTVKFDSCVIKAFTQELKYRKCTRKNRAKRIVTFSELKKAEEERLGINDEYETDIFQQTIATTLFDATIHDELLHKALLSLQDGNREIILLKYWGEMTDSEIGEILSMSRKTVNYHRNRSLKLLRIIIEELKENDKRFEL